MGKVTQEHIRQIYSSTAKKYEMLLRIYQILGVNLGRWREEAMSRLPPLKEPRILDVGVGSGANLSFLVEKYPDYEEIVGVDYTPEMLVGARRRIRKNSWEKILLYLTDAREMTKTLSGKFDLILSTYSLSIIPDSPKVLDEMMKLLGKKGYVMLLDCQKFKGPLRIYNPLAIFLSTRLGGNNETYSVPVSDIAASMFRPVSRRLMYSGMFYEDIYRAN